MRGIFLFLVVLLVVLAVGLKSRPSKQVSFAAENFEVFFNKKAPPRAIGGPHPIPMATTDHHTGSI